ncbi:MAG TPA: aldehyde dehydrogenase family protein, partial [Novosphingobium sp.]
MAELTKYLNVINGELKPANSGQWIESINPATGEVVGLVPDSDESDVNEAVAAARAALPAWRSMPAQQRTFILRQIGQQMAQYGEELAKLETLDNGRLLKENIQRAGIGMSFSWQAAAGQTMEATIGKSANFDPVTYGYTLREPYGVVAVITPWNAPVAMMTQKMSLALAAGNTVVVKPAEVACMAVLRCAEILSKMLPPGVINFVSGLGQKTGVPLVRHRGVNKITMTGSSTTGKAIQRESADNLTTSILELGGKS